MTPLSSIGLADTATASTEVAAKKYAVETPGHFDSFLRGGGGERSAAALRKKSSENRTADDEPTGGDIGSDDQKKADDSERAQKADALALSSCLAAWQILPPTAPIQPETSVPSGEIEGVDPKSAATTKALAETVSSGNDGSGEDSASAGTEQVLPGTNPATAQETSEAAAGEALKKTRAEKLASPPPAPGTTSTTALPKPEAGSAPKTARAGKALEIKDARVAAFGAEIPHATTDGITVAKEQRAMPDLNFHHQEKPAAAAFAEGETSSKASHELSREAAGGVTAPEQTGKDESQGGMSSEQHEHAAADSFTMAMGSEPKRDAEISKGDAKVAASDTAQVIHEIERAIDRMRAQGGQRMEMRIPMRDGQEVVVKLRIEQGEVKATFQSASEGLQHALETGWSHFAQGSLERNGKDGSVVIESPSLQNGMGSFQQSPEQRERGGTGRHAEVDFALPLSQPQNPKSTEPRRMAAGGTASASLELYA